MKPATIPTPRPARTVIRWIVLACAAAGASAAVAMPAQADLKLCNITPNRVGVAIGYRDAAGGWTTEGWWNLTGQTCETLFKGPLTSRYWYVHAVDYDGGGEWAGKSFMCTQDKAFTIKSAGDCTRQGYNRTGFFEV
ncbi:MAG TPA: DUF1036 domain-containing protein, partial [Hyphomicrobiaceae bacterium]|nr:DUF1036 domain-containing protein [Hyphomicrobiaceae bacterium]